MLCRPMAHLLYEHTRMRSTAAVLKPSLVAGRQAVDARVLEAIDTQPPAVFAKI